ncbi:roadblock/LC7 domain-containing protein [Thermosulfuriphilus sp.]
MADFILTPERIEQTKALFEEALISTGVHMALLIDEAGNILVDTGDNKGLDTVSLAALAAANFGATCEIARMIGEEDFTLLFHKGKKESVHFSKIGPHLILVLIFGDDISLGVVRLKAAQVAQEIAKIFGSDGRGNGAN